MTHSQSSIQAQTALLRHASGIDTLVKNSPCCAAAGITALARSSTEERIPHEKLRGAATPGATLNAQSGPLAQPMVGYQHQLQILMGDCSALLIILRTAVDSNSRTFRFMPVESSNSLSRSPENVPAIIELIRVCMNLVALPVKTSLHATRHTESFRDLLLSHKNRTTDLYWKRSFQQVSKCVLHFLQSSQTDHVGSASGVSSDFMNGRISLICRMLGKIECINLFLQSFLGLQLSFQLVRPLSNHKSPNNCSYRTNRLYPSRSVFLGIKCVKQDKQCPSQYSYRHKNPNNPNASKPHIWRHGETLHALWLPAIKKNRACPFPGLASMKEAA